MVKLEDAVIARLSSCGTTFEVLVDPDVAMAVRSGESADLRGALAIDKIFKDSKKGEVASEAVVKKVFGSTDVFKIAEEIIRRGEVQVTTEQRRRMREERFSQIVSIISKRAINPQTGLPHPPSRIESALREAKIRIEEFKGAEEQISEIVKALRPILPLKFETRKIAVKIPASYVGRTQHVVRKLGKVNKEEWLQDGSWAVLVEIPAGAQVEFFDKLNSLTKGEVETRVIE
jgi:ribosome maturation protein SDO1